MELKDLFYLKTLQDEFNTLTQDIKESKEIFEKSIKEDIDKLKYLKERIEEIKGVVEDLAKKEFQETGKKKLLGGIGIREVSSLEYDSKEAFDWAKEKKMCLLLDVKKFEKLALEATDFVKEKKHIQVTFPKQIKLEE